MIRTIVALAQAGAAAFVARGLHHNEAAPAYAGATGMTV